MNSVVVFIDGSNLYHSLKDECGRTDLDYGKFVEWLVGPRRLIGVCYYSVPGPQEDSDAYKAQQRFYAVLARIPYFDVRLGELESSGDTYVEKGVDVAIAIDMLSLATNGVYDTAILVSCDADFIKAVEAVRGVGKHVEVACFFRAFRLKQAADKVISLNAQALAPLWVG